MLFHWFRFRIFWDVPPSSIMAMASSSVEWNEYPMDPTCEMHGVPKHLYFYVRTILGSNSSVSTVLGRHSYKYQVSIPLIASCKCTFYTLVLTFVKGHTAIWAAPVATNHIFLHSAEKQTAKTTLARTWLELTLTNVYHHLSGYYDG